MDWVVIAEVVLKILAAALAIYTGQGTPAAHAIDALALGLGGSAVTKSISTGRGPGLMRLLPTR